MSVFWIRGHQCRPNFRKQNKLPPREQSMEGTPATCEDPHWAWGPFLGPVSCLVPRNIHFLVVFHVEKSFPFPQKWRRSCCLRLFSDTNAGLKPYRYERPGVCGKTTKFLRDAVLWCFIEWPKESLIIPLSACFWTCLATKDLQSCLRKMEAHR